METLIKTCLSIFIFGSIYCQSYKITVLGYHTTDVTQTIHDSGRIEFNAQNRGLAGMIWPMNNYYRTTYDIQNFTLKEWSKNIKQGSFKDKNDCTLNSNATLVYTNHDPIIVSEPIHTIFTLLAKVQNNSSDDLDGKWLKFEHEGRLGNARFLLADSSRAWNGRDSILCDHYRLDLKIIDTLNKIENSKDYFMKNIIDDSFVRELWVSKTHKKQIVLAKIHTPWISLIAQIEDPKEN